MSDNQRIIHVSVAMATYNGEKFLSEQLDSILDQTYLPDEIIICDDCSTDGTSKILKSYADKNDIIKLYYNSHNIGSKRNFEKAMSLCTGDLIALSDQDDIWTTDHIETLLSIIKDKPMAAGNTLLVDAKGDSMGLTLQEKEDYFYIHKNPLKRIYSIILYRNPLQGASMLIRHDFVKQILPISDGVDFHDTWISSASCLFGGFNYTSHIIGRYRQHENNVTKRKSRKKRIWFQYFKIHHCYNIRYDRLELINGLERLCKSEKHQLHTLEILRKVIMRRATVRGRVINMFFTIIHLRTIYTFKIF